MSVSDLFERNPGFFRPLASKYRAQVGICLAALYQRLYGAQASVVHAVSRGFILATFREALINAPSPAADTPVDEGLEVVGDNRERALVFFHQLLDAGWLHKQVDDVSLSITYILTRDGRRFAEALAGTGGHALHAERSHHRNTRQVRNALRSFRAGGEVYDLLDAREYSARILADFTDVIEALDERRRALVSQVRESHEINQASSEFFDFMEQRFQPDIAVRLSADNVEKYRTEILAELRAIRRKNRGFKEDAERRLRALAPARAAAGESLLWQALDDIEQRLDNAVQVLLPALRRALQSFTRRADIVMRQLNQLSQRRHTDIAGLLQRLAQRDPGAQEAALARAADAMSAVATRLPAPDDMVLSQRRKRASVEYGLAQAAVDPEAEKQAWIEQAEARAFALNDQALQEHLTQALADTPDGEDAWPVTSAPEFLALAHRIAAGNLPGWSVEPAGRVLTDTWFEQRDQFVIHRQDRAQTTENDHDGSA